jgi:hypothetical protein
MSRKRNATPSGHYNVRIPGQLNLRMQALLKSMTISEVLIEGARLMIEKAERGKSRTERTGGISAKTRFEAKLK